MKINFIVNPVIPNQIRYNSIAQKRNEKTSLFSLPCDTVSFSANARVTNPLWQTFVAEFHRAYPNQKLEDVLVDCFKNKENFIGEGFEKIVFNIPKMKNFVASYIKVPEKHPITDSFMPYENSLPQYYFGQAIGGNGKFVIMKRIQGASHSLPDWQPKIQRIIHNTDSITPEEARLFLSQLKEIDKFPMSSFEDMAKQLKYLTDNKVRIDSINPNNVMIDNLNKKITFIDLMPQFPFYESIKPAMNGTQDMANVLVDAQLNTKYIEVLSPSEAKEFEQLTRSIVRKCRIAGKKVGLSEDPSIIEQFYSVMYDFNVKNGARVPNFPEFYKPFKEKYADLFKLN